MQVIVSFITYHFEARVFDPLSRIILDVIVFDKAFFFAISKIVTFAITSVSRGYFTDVLNPRTPVWFAIKLLGKEEYLTTVPLEAYTFITPFILAFWNGFLTS
jgi:hypothetical protein